MTDDAKPHNRFISFTQGLVIRLLGVIADCITASAEAEIP